MGRPPGWVTDKTGRAPMPSPGRPPVASREQRRRFWVLIAAGVSSERAAEVVGASAPVGSRWFRHAGGMAPLPLAPTSGRYLSFTEREEIAVLRAGGHGVRQIAVVLGRSPSTVSRELRRNAATRGGRRDYRASVAQWHCELRARPPKPTTSGCVAAQLARDRRGRTTQHHGDLPHAVTTGAQHRNLLPLGEGQVPPRRRGQRQRCHPASVTEPSRPDWRRRTDDFSGPLARDPRGDQHPEPATLLARSDRRSPRRRHRRPARLVRDPPRRTTHPNTSRSGVTTTT